MHRKLSSFAAVASIVAAAAILAPTGRAYAHDQTGGGIGANVTLGGISGLSINYWLTPGMMLEFMLATSMNFPRPDGTDVGFNLGGSVGFFGTLAGNDTTNLMLGGRFAVLAQINQTNIAMASDDAVTIELDVPIRVEHWFDPCFAINAQVGFAAVFTPDVNGGPGATHVPNSAAGGIGGSGLFGGAGFTYYFDGAGQPSASAFTGGGGGSSSSSSGSGSSAPPPSGDTSGSSSPSWE